jgi:glutathione S-transferase
MSLELYFHPLSSFCQKVLIAFYESGTPFERRIIDLGDPESRAALERLWPMTKFPVLHDHERKRSIPESSIIIEYLALHYPSAARLVPAEPERAWETRLSDRFFDLYVNVPMQKIVTDRLRPAGKSDPYGVEAARATLRTAYDMIERELATRTWAVGETFTMADCAAAPALFFADRIMPFGGAHGNAAAYLRRLAERPSVARTFEEARPYLGLVPQ